MESCKTGTKRPHGPKRTDVVIPRLSLAKDDFVRLVATGLGIVIVFLQYDLVLASVCHNILSRLSPRMRIYRFVPQPRILTPFPAPRDPAFAMR